MPLLAGRMPWRSWVDPNKSRRRPCPRPKAVMSRRANHVPARTSIGGVGVCLGARPRALIIVLWRGGLRIQEALTLSERNLDPQRGSVLVRNGKGGRRREIGMDTWGWEQLRPWLAARVELPIGPVFCVIDGPTRGRPWSSAAVRSELRRLAARAGIRRRFAPHQLGHDRRGSSKAAVSVKLISAPPCERRAGAVRLPSLWRFAGLAMG